MKLIQKKIYSFQEDDFFSPIRSKVDYAKLIAISARSLLVNDDVKIDSDSEMKIIVDKMSRLFLIKEGRFISLSFPFNILSENNQVQEITTYSGIKVNSKNISLVISILKNEQFQLNPSILDFYANADSSELLGLNLLETIFQFEPSYIRYDIDPDNENGKQHPLHHLDLNYSTYGTFKLGLMKPIDHNYFEHILNIRTDCCFLTD